MYPCVALQPFCRTVCQMVQKNQFLMQSKTLSKAERIYSKIEKEGFTIICAAKKFHQYCYGWHLLCWLIITTFELLFEEKAIPSMAAAWNQRWAITLSVCNYSLKYRPGSHNSNADFFSRYPLGSTNQESSHFDKSGIVNRTLALSSYI